MSDKKRLKEEILDTERDIDELEDELWNRSKGRVEFYEEYSDEELEEDLNSAKNHFYYLTSCWDSEYPEDNWYE